MWNGFGIFGRQTFQHVRFVITPSNPMPDRNEQCFLPIDPNESEPAGLPPSLQQYALTLYREAWEDYRAVGCPYGETDDAMLVWYSLYGTGDGPALVSGKN